MDLRHQLLSEVTAEAPDRQRIEEILEELGRADVEMERAMVEVTLESRELLDSEEERRYLELVMQQKERPIDSGSELLEERALVGLGPQRPGQQGMQAAQDLVPDDAGGKMLEAMEQDLDGPGRGET